MLRAQGVEDRGGIGGVAGLGVPGGFDELVGDTAHGGDDRDAGRGFVALDDNFGGARDAGGVANGGAAEFHDLDSRGHREWFAP